MTKAQQAQKVIAQRAAIFRANFLFFAREYWKVLEPAVPLVEDDYITGICEHLQAVSEGKAKNLLINMPPGLAKSKLTVLFMAWLWTHSPGERILHLAHSNDLSIRNVNWFRTVVRSQEYQSHFAVKLTSEEEGNLQNDKQGSIFASSIGSKNLGLRCSIIVGDDVNSVDETLDRRKEVIERWKTEITSRLNDEKTGKTIVIQQRLGTDDLSSYLLQEEREAWCWLSLPMEYIPEDARTTEIGWTDTRTQPGEILTSRVTPAGLALTKKRHGASYWAWYQQKPIPPKGAVFESLNIYTDEPDYFVCEGKRIPKKDCRRWATTDLAISEKSTADYTVLCIWAAWKQYLILEHWYRDRISSPKMVSKFKELYYRYNLDFIAIEDVAFQRSMIQMLQEDCLREGKSIVIKPVKPVGDKIARANSGAVILMENKELWLPQAPEIEAELKGFPNSKHDDIVDCVSYAALLKSKTNPFILPEDWDKPPVMSEEQQKLEYQKYRWEMLQEEPWLGTDDEFRAKMLSCPLLA